MRHLKAIYCDAEASVVLVLKAWSKNRKTLHSAAILVIASHNGDNAQDGLSSVCADAD